MAKYRKLGKASAQRNALLRNQVTQLLYHGKIKTTEARAKEVVKIAEKLITLAVAEKDNYDEVTVQAKVAKKDKDGKRVKKDQPSRLHARREMLKVLYPVVEVPTDAAGKKAGTKKIDLTQKLFDEYGTKYAGRKGGYTRIIKIGQRKGDQALEVILELV